MGAMRYRRLGQTGLEVSELSYGAARGASEDPARTIATIHAAIGAGINLIDTAGLYDKGHSERVLGQALVGHPEVLVETKYCPYAGYEPLSPYNGTPAALIASAEESLRRLQRDHLDIFLAHGMRTLASYEQFMQDGCYEAMVKLRQQGKVRFIGLSELSEADGTHQVLQRAVPSGDWQVVMLTINFLLQTAIDSVLPLCQQHGVGTVVMMPLNQASKVSGLVSLEAARECVRRHQVAGNLPVGAPYNDAELFDFLQPYSIPEAGLRFVLAQAVSSCCVGFRTIERLQENLRAVAPPYLDAGRMAKLKSLFCSIQAQER
jgi:L-galactose dehydrogenase